MRLAREKCRTREKETFFIDGDAKQLIGGWLRG